MVGRKRIKESRKAACHLNQSFRSRTANFIPILSSYCNAGYTFKAIESAKEVGARKKDYTYVCACVCVRVREQDLYKREKKRKKLKA